MAFDVTVITPDITASVLAWCGVDSPTPAETAAAQQAADAAVEAIKVYRRLTPEDDFETKYTALAVEMAVYLYTKRGVDGVTVMSENGVQRYYEKGSFPPSMLSRITLPAVTG